MKQTFDIDNPSRRSPYRVPDGFFEQLERDIMNRVDAQPAQVTEAVKPFYRRAAFKWSAAAAVAILAGVALAPLFGGTAPDAQSETLTAQASIMSMDEGLNTLYSKLSDDESDYLCQVYNDDLFYQ